jgi:hypothetical protein
VAHNEATVNALLRALRARTAQETTREEEGKKVADVIPREGVSLANEFASQLGIAPGTTNIYLSALVKAGLLQAGRSTSRPLTRWVALEGGYKNP